MKVPVSWLREYVEIDLPVDELARVLTIAGMEVDKVERTGEDWDHVYVGEVIRVEQHPNADRLVLATVAYGQGELTVVTGAPNIAQGQKVALALEGALLWDAYSEKPRKRKLKAGSIRGVRSEGMVCSERELGLSEEHEGILVLPREAPVGKPLSEVLGDYVLDIDLQPSFAYANNVIGLAREIAAITGASMHPLPEPRLPQGEPGVDAEVQGSQLASRYMLQRLDNLSIKPSPAYIQQRLRASGMRPINNVVDVTNYVMLEYGQPLHGFDTARVDGRVIVRPAGPNEVFETLDHQRRVMPPGTIMIADERKAIGIGGIMGGLHSEVGPETTSILLESATFNAVQIRRSARAMGLRTEASGRFERGMDPELAAKALARAVELLREEAGATLVGGPYDYYPDRRLPAPVRLAHSEVTRVLGVPIQPPEVVRILRSLEFEVVSEPEAVVATPPSYRRDVTLPADLVEEVGRIHGYDSIPATLPLGELPVQRTDEATLLERRTREWLAAAGLQETINYDLTSPGALQPLRELAAVGGPVLWRPVEELVRVLNPLSTEREYLRPSLLPGLLQNVRENLRHQERIWLYELDRVFVRRDGQAELPDEPKRLAMVLTGQRRPHAPQIQPEQTDIFDLKGVIAGLTRALNVRACNLPPAPDLPQAVRNAIAVEVEGRCAGYVFELAPNVLAAAGIEQPVVAAELDWETILRAAGGIRKFQPFSRFPVVRQDLAVGLQEHVPAAEVERIISRYGGRYLIATRLVEVYRGAPLPSGTKSLLYRLAFQASDRTLTEDEASKFRKAVARQLREQLGAEIRGEDES
ncbi:MAG: phenylalanine--tRNA ligase subunit beta [Chloroflexota bacterium]|nr:phenylalanine--tRNA ligase subunit beta [Chloroflexota bacterium]